MSYYDKQINKIDYYGIKYIFINNVNDYKNLKKDIDNILLNMDKTQCIIDAENSLNQVKDEKDKSLCINLPLVISLLFGIAGAFLGFIFGKVGGIKDFISVYVVAVVIYIFILFLIIKRARKILDVYNRKIVFYDTICRIIKEEKQKKFQDNLVDVARMVERIADVTG